MTDWPQLWIALAIFCYALISHGAMLLNDGVYWDGWMVDSWQRTRNWKTMKRFFGEVGLPLYYYLHKFLAHFPARISLYRFIGFASTFLSATAVYFLSLHVGIVNEFYSFVIALLYLSYAGYHMNVDTNVSLQYTFPTAIFYWAAYLALASQDYFGPSHWSLRLISLLMFVVAFNANSILVYYFGFLGVKLLTSAALAGNVWSGIDYELLRNIDYIVLPFLFWFLKERLTPRHGYYVNYNRLRFHPLRFVRGFFNAVRYGVEAAITSPIRSAVEENYLWVPLGASAAVFCAAAYGFVEFPAISPPVATALSIAGAVFLGLAAFPFVVVGQNFAPGGWTTKHYMLFHLPVSLIILGLAGLLFPTRVMLSLVVFVLVLNILHLNFVYLYYIAVVVKDRSWLYKLSRVDNAGRHSFFYISDSHSIQGDRYYPQNSPAYSFYMFEWLWGSKTHIGFAVPPSQHERLSGEQIRELLVATTLDYDMQEVNIHGSQARLEISNGVERSPIRVALMYLKEKYLPRGNVEKFLDRVTDLKYAAL